MTEFLPGFDVEDEGVDSIYTPAGDDLDSTEATGGKGLTSTDASVLKTELLKVSI